MPSLIPGYEYDIFISYRHNDNRSGWVTEFVNALQEELAATIKEPLTIYFDKNPHDGLLETHNVDKSLEGKLKCLIFIPIISQTYCDPKSFAWQHEFCEFNNLALQDSIGRDIKLANGNVASRILPIKIHDLDAEDKAAIENEIGGVLRAIEFIYKEAGVNRPLKPTDSKTDNQNRTDYRNQVNKVANAVKEIIYSLKNPITQTPRGTNNERSIINRGRSKKLIIAIVAALAVISAAIYFLYPNPNSPQPVELDKSIAVLAFDDLSDDQSQEYFSDGISEEILNTLSQIPGLKVSGRTSSFSFKNKDVSIQEIGQTLGVATVLEGSIRKIGNKVRITAQLINAKDGFHIFSEKFDRDLSDIFAVQDEIASLIAQKLKVTLLDNSTADSWKNKQENVAAYEQILEGKYFSSQGAVGVRKSKHYFDKALELAPEFGLAHVMLGRYYWEVALFNLQPVDSVMPLALKEAELALELDPGLAEAYSLKGWYYANYRYDYVTAIIFLEKAIEVNPGYALGHQDLARYYRNIGDIQKGLSFAKKAIELDPLTMDHRVFLAELLQKSGYSDSALSVLNEAIKIYPDNPMIYQGLGYYYLNLKMFDRAVDSYNKENQYASGRDESVSSSGKYMIIAALWQQGDKERASMLLNELLNTTDGIFCIDVAEMYAFMDKDVEAIEWLTKSFNTREYKFPSIRTRSGFNKLHDDPRFQKLEAKIKFP